jgi:hypothetical protein
MYLLWIGIGGRVVEVTIASPAWRQGKIINDRQKRASPHLLPVYFLKTDCRPSLFVEKNMYVAATQKETTLTIPLNRTTSRTLRGARKPVLNRTGAVVVAAVVVCCSLNGCTGQPEQKAQSHRSDLTGAIVPSSENTLPSSFRDMPPWIDLYREKNLVNVANVDHVVMVTFETQGSRDEVYHYYFDRFSNEENFASYRANRDIISFVREGYGIKITLIDSTRNRWSLEYHRQMI